MRARVSRCKHTEYDYKPTFVRQYSMKLTWEFWLRLWQYSSTRAKVIESNITRNTFVSAYLFSMLENINDLVSSLL